MKPNQEPLNKRLERLRRLKGLTAKQMAKLIEVPESTYREWEYGRGLRLPPFQQISRVLAISVTELVTGELPPLHELYLELEALEKKIMECRLKMGSLI